MRFLRQKYWSGLPFPSPVDLPNPGIEPMSPALQADSFCHRATRKKDCSGLYSVSRNLFIMYLIIPPHLSSVLFPSSSHIPSSGNYSGCKWETHNFHWLLVFKGTSFPVCLFGLWSVGVGKDLHIWGFGFLQFYPELLRPAVSPPCTPGAISVPYDTGPLCCALESPGELLKVQMSRTGSISVKSEPEVGVRGQHKHQEFFFFFKLPQGFQHAVKDWEPEFKIQFFKLAWL